MFEKAALLFACEQCPPHPPPPNTHTHARAPREREKVRNHAPAMRLRISSAIWPRACRWPSVTPVVMASMSMSPVDASVALCMVATCTGREGGDGGKRGREGAENGGAQAAGSKGKPW